MGVGLLFRQHHFLNKVCVVFQMTTLAHPKRLNLVDTIIPGKVGSVGDANVTPRLAQSAPDLPMRFNPLFYNNPTMGSYSTSQPYTYDSNWNMGRSEQTAYGLVQQDFRAPDKLHEPTLGAIPQYQWRNKLASVYKAKRTGDMFLPLPGQYTLAPGEMARGGQVVRTTDIEGMYTVIPNQQESPSVGLAKANNALFVNVPVKKGMAPVFIRKSDLPMESMNANPSVVSNPVDKPSGYSIFNPLQAILRSN